MFQLYGHGEISRDCEAKSCVICPYSEIRCDEVGESDDYTYAEQIFYDDADVVLCVDDTAVHFFLSCYFI